MLPREREPDEKRAVNKLTLPRDHGTVIETTRTGADEASDPGETLANVTPVDGGTDAPTEVTSEASSQEDLHGESQAREPILFKGYFQGRPAKFLVDSGASGQFVSEAFIKKNRIPTATTLEERTIQYANGAQVSSHETLPFAHIRIGAWSEHLAFNVLPICHDVILGKAWLEKHNPAIDWRTNTVIIRGRREEITLRPPRADKDIPHSISAMELKRAIRKGARMWLVSIKEETERGSPHDEEHPRKRIVLGEFQDVFPEDLPSSLPPRREVDHHIELEPGSTPPFKGVYKMSYAELEELKKQLSDLTEKGFIQPSKSPYGAPVLFVKKKGGKHAPMC